MTKPLDPKCECWNTVGCQTSWECSLTPEDFEDEPVDLKYTERDLEIINGMNVIFKGR